MRWYWNTASVDLACSECGVPLARGAAFCVRWYDAIPGRLVSDGDEVLCVPCAQDADDLADDDLDDLIGTCAGKRFEDPYDDPDGDWDEEEDE